MSLKAYDMTYGTCITGIDEGGGKNLVQCLDPQVEFAGLTARKNSLVKNS